jgi:sugar phosphate isomerase/epimerase
MQTIDQVSLSTSVFGADDREERTLGRFLDLAQQAGYTMVELSRRQKQGAIEDIRKSGIKVWSIHGIYGGPLVGSEAELQRGVDAACARVEELAEFAPCPVVEHYLDRFNDPAYGKTFRKQIEKLYEFYSKLGFTLCIETAPYKPKQNERYPDSAEIAEFVRSFQKDDLRMTIDINHSNIHEDLTAVCDNCNGLIHNIHVSDNHGEWEDHLPPGSGVIDLKKTFADLRRNGYTGPCNLEYRFTDFPALPTVENLRRVREYVENLLWEK